MDGSFLCSWIKFVAHAPNSLDIFPSRMFPEFFTDAAD